MVEIYADKGWSEYNKTLRNIIYERIKDESNFSLEKIRFLSTGGIPLPIIGKAPNLHNLVDEDIQLSLRLNNRSENDPVFHQVPVRWSIGLYLTKYRTEIEEGEHYSIDDFLIHEYGDNWENPTQLVINFIKMTKMCRVSWKLQGTSIDRIGHETLSECELDIETYYPLTSLQQRFLLDLIEGFTVSSDRVYVDDWSEEQSVKRQLGLHSIVAQFHR